MKNVVYLIKIYPIVVTLIITIGLILCVFDINTSNLTYPVFGHSLFVDIIIMMLSIKFRFCKWHQLLILNLMMIVSVEWLSVNVGFMHDPADYIRLITAMISFTILTSTILYYKHGCNKTSTQKAARQGSENARRR